MPMSLNQVQLCGNLGRDPEIRATNSGGKIANLSIATNKKWTDRQSGEKREATEWHKVDVFQNGDRGLVTSVIEPYLKKGDSVYVLGELRTDKWQDQSGQDRYMTKVAVAGPQHQLLLNSERRQGGSNGASQQTGQQAAEPAPADDDLDDEIPF